MDELLKWIPLLQPIVIGLLTLISSTLRTLRADVNAIKTDVAVLRNWADMHEKADEQAHEDVDRRLDRLELGVNGHGNRR